MEEGNHSQPVRVENESSTLEDRWVVEYSRFFNFTKSLSSTLTNPKILPTHRSLCGGTWMFSPLPASVSLKHGVHDSSNSDTVLVLYLQDNIVEQHLVCNLHFSWPQVSRDTVCPPRGSGAVFASYRDCDSQMQKFAMRFKVASDAQAFMDFIRVQPSPPAFIEQEGSTDKNEIGNSETDLWPEISSSYEFDFPDGPCYRVEELETAFMRTLKQHNWRLGTTVTGTFLVILILKYGIVFGADSRGSSGSPTSFRSYSQIADSRYYCKYYKLV